MMNTMMNTMKRSALIAALLLATAAAALAQVPTRTQIQFDTNEPFAVTTGGGTLPAGHYVLYQESQNPNLFHLYWHDLRREPVAVITTVRGRYWVGHYGFTGIEMEMDESVTPSHLVLRGFRVPFDDPWEVISVTVKESALMTRVQ